MGILDKIISKKKNLVIKITPIGKQKHDQYNASGVKLDVLVYLNDNGTSSIREISEGTRMDEKKVRQIVNSMINEGWVEVSERTSAF